VDELKLFDYQVAGADWLSRHKLALLADRQRLGKTVQSITAMDIVGAQKILIVCRAVAKQNWGNEFDKWSSVKRKKYFVEGSKTDLSGLQNETSFIVITSYESLSVILHSVFLSFDVVVCDESQSLKSVDAKRTLEVFGKNGVCRKTKRLWLLTGTPMPNHAGELWTTLFSFGATKLKYWDFVKRFCITRDSGFGLQIVGTNPDPMRIAELQEIMKKNVLRRTEDDVSIELPKMFFTTMMVEPGPVELQFSHTLFPYTLDSSGERMRELEAKIQKELGLFESIVKKNDRVYATHVLVEALKANATSLSTLRQWVGMQKTKPAADFIRIGFEGNAYEKVVIFSHHKAVIKGLEHYLADFHPVTVYGGTKDTTREKNIRKFNESPRCRIFIGNIAAAGTSIDLSVANHIFMIEQSWTPGDNAQAVMRCGGPKQKKPVYVTNFCLNNSVDQRVQEVLRNKTRDIALVHGENSKYATGTPFDELI